LGSNHRSPIDEILNARAVRDSLASSNMSAANAALHHYASGNGDLQDSEIYDEDLGADGNGSYALAANNGSGANSAAQGGATPGTQNAVAAQATPTAGSE
jgi:type II secretory pathway pseudopilin PulG